ncbi:MAG: PEGA domain-containing protein [Bacillota bacterium]
MKLLSKYYSENNIGNYFVPLLIILFPFLLFSCVDEQSVNNPSLSSNGSLHLQSFPKGASIYILGTNIGKITPDSLIGLESGNYQITLKLQDYKDTTFIASVTNNLKTVTNIVMRTAKKNGSVLVRSNPSGAQILINGSNSFKTTPDTLTGLEIGTIFITLKLQDYKDTTFSVVIPDSDMITQNITLTRTVPIQQYKASITLNSNPQGAMIFLSNSFSGKITPDSLTNLGNGTYLITLKLNEYQDTTFNVTISNNKDVTKSVTLTKIPPQRKASLALNSVPAGAQIYINGINSNRFTPDSLTNLDPGNYLVTLRLSGYNDTTFNVNITNNSRYERNITLSKIIQRKGSIFVRSNPSGAQILLNGNYTGKITPDTLTDLSNGSYVVTLRLNGYYDSTFTASINNYQNLTRDITLRKVLPLKNSISVQSDPSGAQIFLNGVNTGKVTPGSLTDLNDGAYDITLKLNGFIDTTVTVIVSNGINKQISVVLTDNLPAVDVSLDYQITFIKQLIISFQFNQDVLLDKVDVANPDNETSTLNYNGMLISKDDKKGILILKAQNGNWTLTFTGKKAGGKQEEFTITRKVRVKD